MVDTWDDSRRDHRQRQAAHIAERALALIAERGGAALTMAGIAEAAGVSRQTLYRYFDDVDSVLVAIAELVSTHDEAFERELTSLPSPSQQLDHLVETATVHGHGDQRLADLVAVLPPNGRTLLAEHQRRAAAMLEAILRRGLTTGEFHPDLEPATDARLLLGLLDAAGPSDARRTKDVVRRFVGPDVQPTTNDPHAADPDEREK